jgi:hypothetical protein
MNDSEIQFNELLAQVLVRTQKMLKESKQVIPYGILLDANSNIEIILQIDIADNLNEILNFIQEQMKIKLFDRQFLASAIVFANYEDMKVEAYLENNENYCLKVNIPVSSTDKGIELVAEKIETEDGAIFVFPVIE